MFVHIHFFAVILVHLKEGFALSSVIHTADSLLTFPLFYFLSAKRGVWLEPQLESFHFISTNSSEISLSGCLFPLQIFLLENHTPALK